MTVRYLLDENIPRRIQRMIVQQHPELDVLRVGDPGCPPLQSSDDVILEYLAHDGRILVTRNRTSMPEHVQRLETRGLKHWGVFQVKPDTEYQALIEALILFHHASDSDEWLGRTVWIPY